MLLGALNFKVRKCEDLVKSTSEHANQSLNVRRLSKLLPSERSASSPPGLPPWPRQSIEDGQEERRCQPVHEFKYLKDDIDQDVHCEYPDQGEY